MNTRTKTSKIKGALYGFAIGDAMGATTEFMTKEQIKAKFGLITDIQGGGWLNLKPGQVTDDTQMMICVIEAIMSSTHHIEDLTYIDENEFIENCKKNFIEWYKSNPPDVGNRCRHSIELLMQGKDIPVDKDDLGNGSLMRALPCAFLNNIKLNILQGNLTHNNDICSKVIQSFSKNIFYNINDKYFFHNKRFLEEPSGHILNTYNNAKYYYLHYNLEDGIIKAVNDGGDADTIAAITGALLGSLYGFYEIPERWINALDKDVKDVLNKFSSWLSIYSSLTQSNIEERGGWLS